MHCERGAREQRDDAKTEDEGEGRECEENKYAKGVERVLRKRTRE